MVIEMISDQVLKLIGDLIGHQMCMEKRDLALFVVWMYVCFRFLVMKYFFQCCLWSLCVDRSMDQVMNGLTGTDWWMIVNFYRGFNTGWLRISHRVETAPDLCSRVSRVHRRKDGRHAQRSVRCDSHGQTPTRTRKISSTSSRSRARLMSSRSALWSSSDWIMWKAVSYTSRLNMYWCSEFLLSLAMFLRVGPLH